MATSRLTGCIGSELLDLYFRDKLGLCLPCQLGMFQSMYGQNLSANKEEIAALDNLNPQEKSTALNKMSEDLVSATHARLFLAMHNAIPCDKKRAKCLVRYTRQVFHPIVKDSLIHASKHIAAEILVTWKGPFNPKVLRTRDDSYKFCPFQEREHQKPSTPMLYSELYIWSERVGIPAPKGNIVIQIDEESIQTILKNHKPVTKEMLPELTLSRNVVTSILEGNDETTVRDIIPETLLDLASARVVVKVLQAKILSLESELKAVTQKPVNKPVGAHVGAQKPGVQESFAVDQKVMMNVEMMELDQSFHVMDINQDIDLTEEKEIFPELTDTAISSSRVAQKLVDKPVGAQKLLDQESLAAKATSAPTKPLAEVAQKPGDKPAGMDKPVGVDLESLAVESCDIEDVANMLVENELFPEKSGHRMEDKHSVICSFCKTAIKPSQKYVKCQYGKNHLGKTYSYLHYDTKSRKRCAVFESPGETAAPIVTKRLQEFFSIPHTCKTCWDANGVGSIYSDLRGLNEL